MKKFILALVAVASLLCLSSCNSDKYGTYKFFINMPHNIQSDKSLQEIFDYVGKDEYFAGIHSYTGKYSEAATMAVNEFMTHVEALDADYIESRMTNPLTEFFAMQLWCMDPGNCLIIYKFTPKGHAVEK